MAAISRVRLQRERMDAGSTTGRLIVQGLLSCVTLELAWKDNQSGVSCIPAGEWHFRRRYSQANGQEVFTGYNPAKKVFDIAGRTLINIEKANYARQLRGCVALGVTVADLDKDGILDITESRIAFGQFMDLMRDTTQFILDVNNP